MTSIAPASMVLVKLLASVINPHVAKTMFAEENGESQETINVNFESDIKAIDPGFDMSSCKEIMDGFDQ